MGIVDVKIDVMRECQWKKWHRSRPISNPQQQQSDHSNSASAAAGQVNSDEYMEHELYWAATKSSLAEFKSALESVRARRGPHASVDDVLRCVSPLGNTLLHVAAAHGNSSVLAHIASRPASLVLSRNSNGDTPLHLAAEASRPASLVLTRNSNGDTPLHLAAEAGHAAAVSELLSQLRDVADGAGDDQMMTRVKNEQGNTALHKALICSNEAVARTLTQSDPKAMQCLNKEEKSGLYLAAEAGYKDMIRHTLRALGDDDIQMCEIVKGRPPVHGAILGKNLGNMSALKLEFFYDTRFQYTDCVRILIERDPRFAQSKDEAGRTPLHLAAITGYLNGVTYLLSKYALAAVVKDGFGFFPVHWAAMQGRVDVVETLLKHSPDPVELLDSKRRNVLHIAAESGRINVVIFILKKPECRKLINARDEDGNTPLHLATLNWHPRIISALTWTQNLDLSLINNDGLTALDAAEFYMERHSSFQQRLTWTALSAGGAPRAPPMYYQNLTKEFNDSSRPKANITNYKDRVNTLLVVATLIATVTFAAGFTVPGGYISSDSDPNQGQATMLRRKMFSLFIFCDTIAMYSAMIVTVSMIWAQLGDLNLVLIALKLGLPLLGVSLTMMSLAFMSGIYVVVSNLHWLAHGVIIMGTMFFVILGALSFPLCLPISSNFLIWRYISYYPFLLLMYVTNSGTSSSNWEDR